jgi:hypothetical protein
MMWMPADGSSQPQVLFEVLRGRGIVAPGAFSPDGGILVFSAIGGGFGALPRIHTATIEREGRRLKGTLVATPTGEVLVGSEPALSPDGHWLAYTSTENDQQAVYVRPVPGVGGSGQWQISSSAGQTPVWRRDRQELLYRSGDTIMSVRYTVSGGAFSYERPTTWMRQVPQTLGVNWDLAPDGSVYIAAPVSTEAAAPKPEHTIVFLQNFFDELKRRVPVR